MLSVLALASLALASASDPGDEEAWAEHFAEIDRLRAVYGVPPLTPAERMKWILQQAPPFPRYYVVSYGKVKSREEPGKMYESVKIFRCQKDKEETWRWKLVHQDDEQFDPWGTEFLQARKKAELLSKQLGIVLLPNVVDGKLLVWWMKDALFEPGKSSFGTTP